MTTATRSRPRREEVRSQLLDAAASAFATHAYAEVSVSAIAESAGFTKGAVYSNFAGGKPELFAAVLSRHVSGVVDDVTTTAVTALAAGSGDDLAGVVGTALARGVVADQRLPLLLAEFRALATREPGLRETYAELRRTQRAQLADRLTVVGARVPLAPGLDPTVAAALLLTCVNSASLEYAADPGPASAALARALLTHVMTGILA